MTLRSPIDDATALDIACRTDFVTFIGKCFHTLAPNTTFHWNWHIQAMAYHAELVRCGELRRLIVNVPPRSLKSIVYSVALPAFLLGHEPTKRLIVVSYGTELSTKHAIDFRAVINSSWYRRLFPAARISPAKNTESEVMTTAGGYRLATSIDGTLTGRGGDIIIIDDPLKPIDALSEPKRDRVNQWYFNTLLSRLDDKKAGAIILVMQRLHMDDLAGALLRDREEWTHLKLPAIAELDEQIPISSSRIHQRRSGDVLHPEREPMSVLESIRAQLGSDTFTAQYQQSPVPPGGAMIKRIWVRRYGLLPTPQRRFVIQSWDTANKEGGQNDWSVCTTWLIHEKKYYLIDVLRGRFDYPTLKALALEHAQLHRPSKILIEDTGVGTALVQELRGFSAIPVKPERDKQTRMSIQSGKFESGWVYFPTRAPWLPDLEAEVFTFPNSRYDDQVDSISQALAHDMNYGWDATAVANFGKFVEAIAFDRYFGRVTGRPW
jgi:predicted phage terminase large subunit-like protein